MIKCEIIQDLLPLYADGACSDQSQELVEEHTQSCPACSKELAKMQNGEIEVHIQENTSVKIGVLKSVKRKLFKKNIMIAAAASALALLIAFISYWSIFHRDTPMAYVEGDIMVQRLFVEVSLEVDGMAAGASIMDIITSTKSFHGLHIASRMISINGVETEIMYLCLGETLATKWWPDLSGQRVHRFLDVKVAPPPANVALPPIEPPTPPPVEIYYLAAPLNKLRSMSDEDFYAQRNSGVFLWSGNLHTK
ncbi:MAG: zf-HC2 domain-containing protein [Peptococcaceae bacterium]|nr:zf-HC2 domain-containing protein [Peptococcaceae bacterium]